VRVIAIGLLGVLPWALTGCSEPPLKEIDEARSAVEAAQAAGAETYAAEDYAGAAATLQKARASVDQRDYRQALSYAIDARQRAIEASRQVPEGRTRAKTAAETELKKTAESVTHLESLLRAAEDAGAPAQELRASSEALDAAKRVLQETRTTLDARKFAEANTLLRGVRENVDTAAKAVASIPQRSKGKRRSG
jgi:Domain of unknown function (DUF4398)